MKVLVVSVSGLQPGYVGCYGSDWVDTPYLDQLAAEGVVFDQHIADHPEAEAARRAWRTGRYHLPLAEGTVSQTDSQAVDLVELLRAGGVRTALVIQDGHGPGGSFAAGWDLVDRVPSGADEEPSLPAVLDAAEAALDRLAEAASWLLWLDLLTLLPPWHVPEGFRAPYFSEEEQDDDQAAPEDAAPLDGTFLTDPPIGPLDPEDNGLRARVQRSYAATLSYLDQGLGELLDVLRNRELLDEVLVVVTADVGFPLGEHGIVGLSCPWLHEELIHLPLILRLPAAVEAGRRICSLTQPVDLMPTLLEAFGLPIPCVHGQSLLLTLNSDSTDGRTYVCTGLRKEQDLEWALRTLDWHFIMPIHAKAPRGPQLYRKPEDRWEVNSVLQHHLDLADHLEQTLRGFIDATRRQGPLQWPVLRAVEHESSEANLAPASTTPPEETTHEHGQASG